MKRLALVLVVLVAGCSSAAQDAASLTLDEFSIRSSVDSVEAGTIAFDVQNVGEFGHTVVVADETGMVVAASDLLEAGSDTEFVVELEPGQYEFTCRIVFQSEDGRVIDHYEEGMRTSIEVDQSDS